MTTVLKRPLTPEEQADAKRLKSAWEAFRAENNGVTQYWLGKVTGLGGRSVIAQYLNGFIQLNHKALLSICKVIRADPEKISPTLTANTLSTRNAPDVDAQQHPAIDPDEMRLLTLYRESTPKGKRLIIEVALTAEKSRSLLR